MRKRSKASEIASIRSVTRYCECGCGGVLPPPVVSTRIPRYLIGHNRRKEGLPYEVDGDCWIWQRGKNQKGYGRIHREGRKWLAHVWYYVQKHGPVPNGLQLDHLCKRRDCCNPAHLEPVTPSTNQRRGRMAKLTLEQIDEVQNLRGVLSSRAVAKRYGVSYQTVLKYWRWIQ